MIVPLAIGLVLGVSLIGWARWRGGHAELRVYGMGLAVAALLYVAFALAGGASARWVLVEVVGVLPFATAAWVGLRRPLWLGLGWAVHVAWDVGLHVGPSAPGFVPSWYPVLCISVDLVLAGYLVARSYSPLIALK